MAATIHAAYLRLILKSAEAVGLDARQIDDRMALTATAPGADDRVSVAATYELWAMLVELSGDATIGLRLAGHAQRASAGVLEYAARNSPTVGELLQTVARYARLLNTGAAIKVNDRGRRVQLSYRLLESHPVHPASIDFVLGYLMYRVRALTGRQVVPAEVDLPQTRPANPRPYHVLFGQSIRWAQPVVRVCFAPEQWQTALQAPDPELADLMRAMVEREMAQLPEGDDICAQVEAEILRAGGGATPSLDAIAERLGLTARTVQRRLKEDGTTFRALSKRVRMDRAAELLTAGRLTLAEVAFEVGFSEPSGFCRAFRKVFGRTPTEYREAAE